MSLSQVLQKHIIYHQYRNWYVLDDEFYWDIKTLSNIIFKYLDSYFSILVIFCSIWIYYFLDHFQIEMVLDFPDCDANWFSTNCVGFRISFTAKLFLRKKRQYPENPALECKKVGQFS